MSISGTYDYQGLPRITDGGYCTGIPRYCDHHMLQIIEFILPVSSTM